MDEATVKVYDEQAKVFAARYADADVSALQWLLLRYLPPESRVLEIGCGTGREALFLAQNGFRVVASDASKPMLEQLRKATHDGLLVQDYPGTDLTYCPAVQILPAAFPLPAKHPFLKEKFSAIIGLAVVMHIPDQELFEFACQIRQLLKPGGTVILSVSTGREVNSECRDQQNRLFRERPAGEIGLLFERLGFRLIARESTGDGMGRDNLEWTNLVLRLDNETEVRPVDQIETIINRDRKDATYKLALLRALCEIAQTNVHHVRWHDDDTVSVPLGLIAEKWLYYYWPLIDTGDEPLIPQKRGMEVNKPIAFRGELTALASHFRGQNGLTGFHAEFQDDKLDENAALLVDRALNKIANTIVAGPVKYATQGDFSFGDGHRTANGKCGSPDRLYAALGRVRFRSDVWRELCLVGHWIGEAIILRWGELTVEISNRQVQLSRVLEKLLTHPETERDVRAVRQLFQSVTGLACVWTEQPLDNSRFDMDHVIPFKLWRSNDLWNLVPAAASVNNAKRDKLVTRRTLLDSRERIIECWQQTRRAMPHRFDIELNRTLLGRNFPEKNWENRGFAALVEAVETTAVQRGVERWDATTAVRAPRVKRQDSKKKRFQPEITLDERSVALPFFPELGIACGVPKEARAEFATDSVRVPKVPGKRLSPERYFVVRAEGDSMDGGNTPIRNGDYVIMEWLDADHAGSLTSERAVAVEYESDGDICHALKQIRKDTQGRYWLHSWNRDYPDMAVDPENCRPRARLVKAVPATEMVQESE